MFYRKLKTRIFIFLPVKIWISYAYQMSRMYARVLKNFSRQFLFVEISEHDLVNFSIENKNICLYFNIVLVLCNLLCTFL